MHVFSSFRPRSPVNPASPLDSPPLALPPHSALPIPLGLCHSECRLLAPRHWVTTSVAKEPEGAMSEEAGTTVSTEGFEHNGGAQASADIHKSGHRPAMSEEAPSRGMLGRACRGRGRRPALPRNPGRPRQPKRTRQPPNLVAYNSCELYPTSWFHRLLRLGKHVFIFVGASCHIRRRRDRGSRRDRR